MQSAAYSQPIPSEGERWLEVSEAELTGQDLWKQSKRVSIPTFSGNKQMYQKWKAAFMACIEKVPTMAEHKLLQFRQCLSGEALKAIESLGYSPMAYEAAKERLERNLEETGGKLQCI